MKYHVVVGERTFEVELGPQGLLLDGRDIEATLGPRDGTPVRRLAVDGGAVRLVATRVDREKWRLLVGGQPAEAQVVDERAKAIRDMTGAGASASGPRPVVAPMPGMVIKVEVEVGDRVETGQGVVIVEAMKMENELRASAAGIVRRIHCRPGDAVEKDQVLVDLGAAGEGED